MPLPDRRLPAVVFFALALAGCGKQGVKPPSGPLEVAPTYEARDNPEIRKRVNYQDQMVLAGESMRAGALDAAEKRVRAATKIDARRPEAYMMLAAIATQRGNEAGAGPLYAKAAELAPDRGDVLNNYGAWLCAHGRPAESLVWFDRALQAPGYTTPASALANAGGCALEAGQSERATPDLRRALEIDPVNAYALESMARSEYAQGRYFEARAFAQRRLAAAPATRSVLQLASQIEARLGDNVASGRYLQRIHDEFPQDAAPNPRG
ncbi:type IV pilus assembly protein PilF [Stenotrophomonas rhizophila]|uniref:type IV pilus biogenesis/stability protein PilW n=1 Tax=Stenotrophomonas TaxID=40323 RepID=UPI000F4AFEF1|nr:MULTISPECIES: type IV pilus biogenesis/stability protein PilW [Stenotrophomonas]MCW6026457.1 type IV pilus biogenesis/stability protein PilW [Stenotrophomonas sp. SRS1]ROP79960.1 type IV pilus assembly protein PilF [Stenotrophomonas rhizophila]